MIVPIILFVLSIYSDIDGGFWTFCMVASCFAPVLYISNFVYQFVNEKEEKIKETYKIMGLN